MKSLSTIFKPVFILWLCLFSLIDFKSFPNLVLCLGQDGHIELETALNDRCGNGAQSIHPDFLALNPADDEHCGECSDIPLISDFAQGSVYIASSGTGPESFLFTLSPIIPFLSFFPREIEKPKLFSPPSLSSVLASIRSVRILV